MSFRAEIYRELEQGRPQTSRREYELDEELSFRSRHDDSLHRLIDSLGIIFGRSEVTRRVRTCGNCGLSGHDRRTCPALLPQVLYHSARRSPACSICRRTGHDRRTCPLSAPHAPYTATSEEVDALPRPDTSLHLGGSNQDMMNQGQCSICLDEFLQGQTLIKLPCGHMYHPECLTPWLTNHDNCPYCRGKIHYQMPRRE